MLCFSKHEPYVLDSTVAKAMLQVYYVFSLIKIIEFWGEIYSCQSISTGTHPIAGEKKKKRPDILKSPF